jgi:hypothetical protein
MEVIKRTYSGVPLNSEPVFYLIFTCATDEAVLAWSALLEIQREKNQIGLPYFHYNQAEKQQGYVLRCERKPRKILAEMEELAELV